MFSPLTDMSTETNKMFSKLFQHSFKQVKQNFYYHITLIQNVGIFLPFRDRSQVILGVASKKKSLGQEKILGVRVWVRKKIAWQ